MPKQFMFLKWSGKKAVAFLVLTIVLLTAVIGTTLAYLVVLTDTITNDFVSPNIEVQLANNKITNKGDVTVYVRATAIARLVDAEGKILATTPAITLTPNEGWTQGSDGFYYFQNAIAPNATAVSFVKTAAPLDSVDGNYTLQVTVLSEAIQANPADAVTSSWAAVSAVNSDGTLVVVPFVATP